MYALEPKPIPKFFKIGTGTLITPRFQPLNLKHELLLSAEILFSFDFPTPSSVSKEERFYRHFKALITQTDQFTFHWNQSSGVGVDPQISVAEFFWREQDGKHGTHGDANRLSYCVTRGWVADIVPV